MSDTGAKAPGTVESESWSGTFTVALINTSDNQRATHAGTSYVASVESDFTFGIPAGATINGIKIDAEVKEFNGGGDLPVWFRSSLSYDDGAHFTATEEKTTSNPSDHVETFGGATSLWGRSWTDAEFANGTFQLKFECKTTDLSTTGYLDLLTVTVYYTEGGAAPATDKFFAFF